MDRLYNDVALNMLDEELTDTTFVYRLYQLNYFVLLGKTVFHDYGLSWFTSLILVHIFD